jgi:hypothetical protein
LKEVQHCGSGNSMDDLIVKAFELKGFSFCVRRFLVEVQDREYSEAAER